MSEHHYDEPRIDDSSLNMLNFGDDYRNYIDSLSEDENDLDDIPRRPRVIVDTFSFDWKMVKLENIYHFIDAFWIGD